MASPCVARLDAADRWCCRLPSISTHARTHARMDARTHVPHFLYAHTHTHTPRGTISSGHHPQLHRGRRRRRGLGPRQVASRPPPWAAWPRRRWVVCVWGAGESLDQSRSRLTNKLLTIATFYKYACSLLPRRRRRPRPRRRGQVSWDGMYVFTHVCRLPLCARGPCPA